MTDRDTRNPTPDEAPVAARTIPPFSPGAFRRRFLLDGLIRAGLVTIVALGLVVVWRYETAGPALTSAMVVAIVAAWIWAANVNGRVMRRLDEVLALTEQDTAAAEHLLAELMDERGLVRWVRLVLHHRLALLRHRQQRFDEAAAVARCVLQRPLGPAEGLRGNLLLLLVEADLKRGDVVDAYHVLTALAGMDLPLVEHIQRMALQTQYEVMLGHDGPALHDLRRKIALAELMPPVPCGAWHASVAVAADRAGRADLAAWLRRRARLLSDAEVQVSAFEFQTARLQPET